MYLLFVSTHPVPGKSGPVRSTVGDHVRSPGAVRFVLPAPAPAPATLARTLACLFSLAGRLVASVSWVQSTTVLAVCAQEESCGGGDHSLDFAMS
jgi:hypothetical protein